MIRAAALAGIALLLAACSGAGLAPIPDDQTRASFPPGGVANQIEITAVDRLPLRMAELIAPDGHATPALSVTANPAPQESFSQQFPNTPYAAPSFGIAGIGSNALAPGIVGGAPNSQTKLLAVVSNASIQLPDPLAYRRDWPKYRIRLQFGDPPQVEAREIAAPAPPPPQ